MLFSRLSPFFVRMASAITKDLGVEYYSMTCW